jgi:hypothetical protein
MGRLYHQVIVLYLLGLFFSYPLQAQLVSDSGVQNAAIKHAIHYYHNALSPENALYNGSEYIPHAQRFRTGHAWFISDIPQAGNIHYNKRLFQNVLLMLDMIRDELVIIHPVNHFRVRLIKDKIDSFTIINHHFIHIQKESSSAGLSPGFYEQVYQGTTQVLKKQTKTIEEQLETGIGAICHVSNATAYYLRKGNRFISIRNKRGLLKAFEDRKKEMRNFQNKHRWDWRTDRENIIIQTVAYYDEIKPM